MDRQPFSSIEEAISVSLQHFPVAGREHLADLVSRESFSGVIGTVEARTLADHLTMSIGDLMLALLPLARAYAYPPISGYVAGAVIRGISGALILGANLEFPGSALADTVHAEQAAVMRAVQLGERSVTAIAVRGTPCGHCRQFLIEINNPHLQVINPRAGSRPLTQLLPDAFTPDYLGNSRGLMEPGDQSLTLESDPEDELIAAAGHMAGLSYAPYSKNLAGVAVRTSHGLIIGAPYLESVAFNPSLPPLQGVLIALRMRNIPWNSIRDAVLVESADAPVSQEQASRALLERLADCPLRVVRV